MLIYNSILVIYKQSINDNIFAFDQLIHHGHIFIFLYMNIQEALHVCEVSIRQKESEVKYITIPKSLI